MTKTLSLCVTRTDAENKLDKIKTIIDKKVLHNA